MFKKLKVLAGILSGRVFTGPLEASIDITNKCSLGCITCWFYSPLRKEKLSEDWMNQQMDFEFFKRVIDELRQMQVKRIMLGADGDPFLHPRALDMIEYAKRCRMAVQTATCGIYFDENNLRRLFDSGLDGLNISILAATPKTYRSMHPFQKEELFHKVKQAASQLSEWKREEKRKSPRINLIIVICKLNYFEVKEMVDLAKEVGAQEISFKRLAVMPFTLPLLLDNEQVKVLEQDLVKASQEAYSAGIKTNVPEFRKNMLAGFTSGDYTSRAYSQVPCYIGWLYSRILCDGSVVPCCGCYNYSIGNLHRSTFKEIWESREYKEFRKGARKIVTDPAIARQCICHSCAHLETNMGIYRKLHF